MFADRWDFSSIFVCVNILWKQRYCLHSGLSHLWYLYSKQCGRHSVPTGAESCFAQSWNIQDSFISSVLSHVSHPMTCKDNICPSVRYIHTHTYIHTIGKRFRQLSQRLPFWLTLPPVQKSCVCHIHPWNRLNTLLTCKWVKSPGLTVLDTGKVVIFSSRKTLHKIRILKL